MGAILSTDSIFSSLVIAATWFLISENKSKRHQWISMILILILPFFRPTGFSFLFIACFYWAAISFRKNAYKILFFITYLSAVGFVVYKTFAATNSYYFPIHSLWVHRKYDAICKNTFQGGDVGIQLSFAKS
jgi:hypothetical protein